MSEKKAVVLLSGGLDSTTVVAIAKQQGFAVYALSFDYGQNHKIELEFPARVWRVCSDVGRAGTEESLRRGHGPRGSGDVCSGAQHRFPVVGAGLGGVA